MTRKILSYTMLAVILVGYFCAYLASSSLTSSVLISSIGSIGQPSNVVNAASGSPQDIQNAVNIVAAAGGGTVYVPAGTFNWNNEIVTIPGGVNVIGAGIGVTILKQTKAAPFNEMFRLDGTNGKRSRISGLELRGLVTGDDNTLGSGIFVDDAVDFRIDHSKFVDFPNMAIGVFSSGTKICRGVIDHNIIDNPYKDVYGGAWGYGIIVASDNYDPNWAPLTTFLGKYETIPVGYSVAYIEDNVLSRCRHAIASNQRGWYCARYNTISEGNPANFGYIDVHGATSTAAGGRGLEAYNNMIVGIGGTAGSLGFACRGGSGVFYNNVMTNQGTNGQTVRILQDNPNPVVPLSQMYFWNNTAPIVNYDNVYVENVNYFLRAPNQAQDGFTYTPYPYPHPLTLTS